MGIQHSVASLFSEATVDSYATNVQFAIDVERGRIDLYVRRYADKASMEAGKAPIQSIPYTIQGDAFNAHVAANQAAYQAVKRAVEEFLLTRPEFEGGEVVA